MMLMRWCSCVDELINFAWRVDIARIDVLGVLFVVVGSYQDGNSFYRDKVFRHSFSSLTVEVLFLFRSFIS